METQKSTSTLEEISIQYCPVQKLTPEMFRGLLSWNRSNITAIENGAFDDLVELQSIRLANHRIEILPDGLFKHNRKLRNVIMYRTSFLWFESGIENLSRSNFSHVENFEELNFLDGI